MGEEDPVERARRHVRAESTAKTVELLQLDLKAKEEKIIELEKKLSRRSTTLTKKLDRNTNYTIVCCVLVIIALVGPTDKVAAFVVWITENYRKTSK